MKVGKTKFIGLITMAISALALVLIPNEVFAAGEKAKIEGAGEYMTVQAAIDAAGTTESKIVLLDDISPESIEIAADQKITLDLNGKEITNVDGKHTIINKGTLTIIGTGTVDNVSHQKAAVFNDKGATIVLAGGTYKRSAENGQDASNHVGIHIIH